MTDLDTKGRLDRIRGHVRSTWAEVTDDDFEKAQGSVERLIGAIKERTGRSLEEIQEKLERFLKDDSRNGEGEAS
ncbi:MAG TPA: CsbD family protein [Dehalococcoidia bacterium]|nr:CsbD family protein [Dehalococcoidia bacterium]